MPKTSSTKLAEPKANNIEEIGVDGTKILEITRPSAEVTVPKAQKGLIATPKRKRMVNVLDALETIKTSSSTPRKTAEASKAQTETKLTEAKAAKSQAETGAGPSEPAKEKSLDTWEEEMKKEAAEQILPETTATPTPEASSEVIDYIVRHASGKRLSEEEKREAQYYAQKLKYPKGH
jgi:Ni/Co efflux regulator RcnB